MENPLILMQAKATRFSDHKEEHGKKALKLAGLGEVEAHITPTTRKLSELHKAVARALHLLEPKK